MRYNVIVKKCIQISGAAGWKKGSTMPIKYDKLFALLEQRKITIYRLRKDNVIGGATLEKMRKSEKHIDTRSIESLCRYLDCQPGDIMEYVQDEREGAG